MSNFTFVLSKFRDATEYFVGKDHFGQGINLRPDLGVDEVKLLALVQYCNSLDLDTFSEDFNCLLASVADRAEARVFIRGFFLVQFEIEVMFLDDIEGEVDVSVAQILGFDTARSIFWASINRGFQGMRYVKGSVEDWLWSVARKAFEVCLGSHYEVLMGAASWVKDVWLRMQTWCADIIASSAQWLEGFRECLVMGVGIVGVAAVLVLIEKFLISSGMLTVPLGLAQTFVLCYVAYVGIREGKGLLCEGAMTMVNGLVVACKNVVKAISSSMDNDGTLGSNAQFSPISFLEVFSSSLASFSSESVIGVGRVFNSFTQIKSGTSAIWSCVQQIFDYLWILLDKGFGIRSRALADLSTMLGKDVQGWLNRCDAACEHMCIFPSVPQEILTNLKVLKVQGQEIRSALLSRTERGSVAALGSVTKALERLSLLLNGAIMAGSSGPRFEPMWVAFVGAPGVGKSTVVNMLVSRYLRDNSLDATDFYARNTTDPFWSGYRRQAVVTYDDLGALSSSSGLCEEGELIKLVSRDALPLNMARLEEKGMYFDSSLIVTSSNFVNYSPQAQIHDAAAYQRRRTLLVRVESNGQERDPEAPLAHQQYSLLRSSEPFEVLQTFATFEDLYAHFINVGNDHAIVQKQIMSAMQVPEKTLGGTICAMTSLMALLMPFVPISFESYIKEHHPGYVMLACYAGKLYLWNLQMELKVVDDYRPHVDIDDERRAEENALTVALRFKDVLRGMPTLDPLAAHFLFELVEKNSFTAALGVNERLKVEDEQLYGVAANMPAWQRAFVHVLSSSLRCQNKGFFRSVYDGMCTTLQKTYAADVSKWPVAVKLGFGVVALLIFGGTMFKAFQYLGNFGCGAAFAVAATKTFTVGQSDDEVRRKTSEYRHRNNPIRQRHWSYGQNFGTGYEWLMKHCLASLRYAHLDCQVLMLPGKRLVGVHHFLRRIPNNVIVKVSLDEQSYHINWHVDKLKQLEDSELSLYSHPTLREVSSSVEDRVVFGLEHLPDTFAATMASCKYDEVNDDYVPEVAALTVMKRNKPLTVYVGEYQRVVPVCLEYKAPTVNKDCGSLIIANVNGVDKLVGIHVAGLGGYGQACFLPASLERSRAQNWFDDHFVEFPFEEQVGNGVSVVGLLKEERKFYTQQKTSYVATPEEWHLETPCDKEPAILSRFDERLVGVNMGYDPYRSGMNKYSDEAGPFKEEILQEVVDEIDLVWHDAKDQFDFAPTGIAEAINGVPGVEYMDALVMNTSEGYPYLLSRKNNKGKSRFLIEVDGQLMPNEELAAGIERIEKEARVGVPVLVGVECAKDEKLPIRKIYDQPKTRLFTVLPMDYNIVVRRYFFPFVKFFMSQRHRLPCQVGVNPYGREWSRIAMNLQSKGNSVLCCDYSRFDGLIPKHVMYKISQAINNLMQGGEQLCTIRTNLLLACCGRYGICAGKVWRVENGIPSGFPLTVILNSIFNEMIIRYLYKEVFWADALMRKLFDRYISLVVYGDDNLISIHPTIHMKFDGKIVQSGAKNLNITITDGVDKYLEHLEFRELESCDFLKRKFVQDERGLWRAPMELESLWSQLHWVKTQFLGKHEAYLVNLESVLRELVIHSVEMARSTRYKALRLDWIEPHHLPTIEQLVEWHEMQLYGNTEFSGYAYDAILTPASLGPIGKVGKEEGAFEYKRMVATVSGSYKYEDGDFVVCLQVASKYGDNGMSLFWPPVSGRGELPVAHWLRSHVLRKGCEVWKKLYQIYMVDGRRLVFLGRNSNVASTVILVLVGLQLGVISVEESNTVLAKAMDVTSSLGYLVDAFPEAFFSKSRHSSYSIDNFPVFGASPYEVTLLRKFSGRKNFELRKDEVPVFEDAKLRVDFCRKLAKYGVIVETWLDIPELGGLPGFRWAGWIHRKRHKKYECIFGVRVTVFDRYNIDIFTNMVEGFLNENGKFAEALEVKGVALANATFEQLAECHPLGPLVSRIEDVMRNV